MAETALTDLELFDEVAGLFTRVRELLGLADGKRSTQTTKVMQGGVDGVRGRHQEDGRSAEQLRPTTLISP
ncbi:hypothetical protein [Streptomyces sp. NPDC058622]|uniref:hypothetical protein n=1 Tax=Streptomyces sp. NPDC058622 TaxID=3346562 RepID=UPI003668B230